MANDLQHTHRMIHFVLIQSSKTNFNVSMIEDEIERKSSKPLLWCSYFLLENSNEMKIITHWHCSGLPAKCIRIRCGIQRIVLCRLG